MLLSKYSLTLLSLLAIKTAAAFMYDKTHQLCRDVILDDLNINNSPAYFTDTLAYYDETAGRQESKYGQAVTYMIAINNHLFYTTYNRKRKDLTFKNVNSNGLFYVYGLTYFDATSLDPNAAQHIRFYLFGDQECRIPADMDFVEMFVQQIDYKR